MRRRLVIWAIIAAILLANYALIHWLAAVAS